MQTVVGREKHGRFAFQYSTDFQYCITTLCPHVTVMLRGWVEHRVFLKPNIYNCGRKSYCGAQGITEI